MAPSPASTAIQPMAAGAPNAFTEFDLDVQVTLDAAIGYAVRRCDTSDGCAATCASSCASS
jgi:FxLD family lantipeptide